MRRPRVRVELGKGTGQMISAVLQGLCDDAAIFPPGLTPLEKAVPAHRVHARAPYADLVGAFIVSADHMPRLGELLGASDTHLPLAVTAPRGPQQVPALLEQATQLPVDLKAIEVAVPGAVGDFLSDLRAALDASDVDVFVEIPRDDRRRPLIEALASTPYKAKFRTGGVTAEMYPSEHEFAEGIVAVVQAGMPFKATAGLHHAVRNTAADTGFEQHGFLNVLLAVDAALQAGSTDDVKAELGQRDGHAVATRVSELDGERVTAIRNAFVGFGTCSIIEPLEDLVALGLVPASLMPQHI